MKIKVTNEWGVPNQFQIVTDEEVYFQSYESIIAFIPSGEGKTQIGTDWDYSRTTGKYRNLFLGETKQETEAKLKSGEYILNPEL